MSAVQMIVTPAYLDRIRDGHELANLIHEAAFDAFATHKIRFDLAVADSLILNIATELADECDTAKTADGAEYHLVPVTTYIPIEKAAAA